jgi:hypothetical protein
VVYTYGFILLVEVVHVAIQYLDEEFDRYGSVHAGISHTERTL